MLKAARVQGRPMMVIAISTAANDPGDSHPQPAGERSTED